MRLSDDSNNATDKSRRSRTLIGETSLLVLNFLTDSKLYYHIFGISHLCPHLGHHSMLSVLKVGPGGHTDW